MVAVSACAVQLLRLLTFFSPNNGHRSSLLFGPCLVAKRSPIPATGEHLLVNDMKIFTLYFTDLFSGHVKVGCVCMGALRNVFREGRRLGDMPEREPITGVRSPGAGGQGRSPLNLKALNHLHP